MTPGADLEPTDADLLAAHVAGDDRAFTVLMERHADRLWSIVRSG